MKIAEAIDEQEEMLRNLGSIRVRSRAVVLEREQIQKRLKELRALDLARAEVDRMAALHGEGGFYPTMRALIAYNLAKEGLER